MLSSLPRKASELLEKLEVCIWRLFVLTYLLSSTSLISLSVNTVVNLIISDYYYYITSVIVSVANRKLVTVADSWEA